MVWLFTTCPALLVVVAVMLVVPAATTVARPLPLESPLLMVATARVRRSPGYRLSQVVGGIPVGVGIKLQGCRRCGNGRRALGQGASLGSIDDRPVHVTRRHVDVDRRGKSLGAVAGANLREDRASVVDGDHNLTTCAGTVAVVVAVMVAVPAEAPVTKPPGEETVAMLGSELDQVTEFPLTSCWLPSEYMPCTASWTVLLFATVADAGLMNVLLREG